MSSQQDTGILLTHSHNGIGYKLLELPPELVALLESENPPMLVYQIYKPLLHLPVHLP